MLQAGSGTGQWLYNTADVRAHSGNYKRGLHWPVMIPLRFALSPVLAVLDKLGSGCTALQTCMPTLATLLLPVAVNHGLFVVQS